MKQKSGRVRIPKQTGRRFRFDPGHGSDLMPATIPKISRSPEPIIGSLCLLPAGQQLRHFPARR
jgi:hypothetical protein